MWLTQAQQIAKLQIGEHEIIISWGGIIFSQEA